MKAVTWHGKRDVRVESVPDPLIEQPTDAIVRITSTAICGSDLHIYELLGPFMDEGDVLGHEPMGIVEEVGSGVTGVRPGDRVVVAANIACSQCAMCSRQLFSQCETTQVREHGMGAALYGYSKLYGSVPGGQAEYLRVPFADVGLIKIPDGPPDERFLMLSDILPTAWQGVEYASIPDGGSVVVFGLGPVGQLCARIARYRGAGVIAVDRVPERLAMAKRHGIDVLDQREVDDIPGAIRDRTGGLGPDSVIEAVGMEAHGSPVASMTQRLATFLPDVVAEPIFKTAGIDRLAAFHGAIETVRRGGTLSLVGVYGGMMDPLPMLQMFDKSLQIRMGQVNVKRWLDKVMPLTAAEDDPIGLGDLVTHHLPLDSAPEGYEMFQQKRDGAIKVVLHPDGMAYGA